MQTSPVKQHYNVTAQAAAPSTLKQPVHNKLNGVSFPLSWKINFPIKQTFHSPRTERDGLTTGGGRTVSNGKFYLIYLTRPQYIMYN